MSEKKDTSKENIQKITKGANGNKHMRHVQNPHWSILKSMLVK